MIVAFLGWSGAAVLLVAYALVSRGRVTGDGFAYQAMNVYGAAALAVNSGVHGAWPSVALNLVWLAIGVLALRRAGLRRASSTTASRTPA